MHFKPLKSLGPGFQGSFTIDDLTVFTEAGRLVRVHHAWLALTKYSLLIDQTHAHALQGVRQFLSSSQAEADPAEAEDIAFAEMEHQMPSDSDNYFVKSMLFLCLVSFNEIALKEVYQLFQPPEPPPPRKRAFMVITSRLMRLGVFTEATRTPAYDEHFYSHIEPVRNNFAHGDWSKLKETLTSLDLSQSFLVVAQFFWEVQHNLATKWLAV
jgi:hypothetical protein